jgi:hypothetical protein
MHRKTGGPSTIGRSVAAPTLRRSFWAWPGLAAALCLSCGYDPHPTPGSQECATGSPACPDGYVCKSGHCWLAGSDLGLGGATSSGGTTSKPSATGGAGGISSSTRGSGGQTSSATSSGTGGATGSGWRVEDGGYVTTGSWHGYAWTAALTGSSITPAGFSTVPAGSPLCASGSVAPQADYGGWAMLGVNLNQAQSANAPANTVVPTGTGVTVSVSNPGGSALRVQISGPTGETDANDRWCATISGSGDFSLPWSKFNTRCWDSAGTAYSGQPLQAIAILVPGSNTAAVPFNFCLTSITEGAGGSQGSGGIQGTGGGQRASGGGGGGGTSTAGASGGSGGQTGGTTTAGQPPSNLSARAVGAYSQIDSTCTGASYRSGFAAFLCPGGRIRAAGFAGSSTELMCGSYTTTAPSMPNCTDKVGCYAKVHATVKDTLVLSGQTDVDPSYSVTMLMLLEEMNTYGADILMMESPCTDGSSAYVYLGRVSGNVSSDDCVSSACPAPGTASGYGTCGTDCDCGRCWYCESGTCRYGGEGPYGCYRGCTW